MLWFSDHVHLSDMRIVGHVEIVAVQDGIEEGTWRAEAKTVCCCGLCLHHSYTHTHTEKNWYAKTTTTKLPQPTMKFTILLYNMSRNRNAFLVGE